MKKKMGDPIAMLSEEASEVVQAHMKMIRFGAKGDNHPDYSGPTPREQWIQEIGDFEEVLSILIKKGLITHEEIWEAIRKKSIKLKEMFDE